MLKLAFISLCFICPYSWSASPMEPLSAIEKHQLQQLEQQANTSEQDNSLLHLKLAMLYHRDQEQEKGLKFYLKALELSAPLESACSSSQADVQAAAEQEEGAYAAALHIYIDSQVGRVGKGSEAILQQYAPIVEKNPGFRRLAFIVAAAFANQGDFSHALELFYSAYRCLPNHYLAHKLAAILHLKLLEKLPPGAEREFRRQKVVYHLKSAIEQCAFDPSIYKLFLFCSAEADKPQAAAWTLMQIVERDVAIPRADLSFFIEQGLQLQQLEPLRRFIDKASVRFPASRILLEAKNRLNTIEGSSC